MTMKYTYRDKMPAIKNNRHIFWKYLQIFICLNLIQISEGTAQSGPFPDSYKVNMVFGQIVLHVKNGKYSLPQFFNGKKDIFISSDDEKFVEEFVSISSMYHIHVTTKNENQRIKVLALWNIINSGIVNLELKKENPEFSDVFDIASSRKLSIPCHGDTVSDHNFSIISMGFLLDLKDEQWRRKCGILLILSINGILFSEESNVDFNHLYKHGPKIVEYVSNCMKATDPVSCVKAYQ